MWASAPTNKNQQLDKLKFVIPSKFFDKKENPEAVASGFIA